MTFLFECIYTASEVMQWILDNLKGMLGLFVASNQRQFVGTHARSMKMALPMIKIIKWKTNIQSCDNYQLCMSIVNHINTSYKSKYISECDFID